MQNAELRMQNCTRRGVGGMLRPPVAAVRSSVLLALLVASCAAPARHAGTPGKRPWPIQVAEIVRTLDGQPIRGWLARVDLTDPRVEFTVTPPRHDANDPPGAEVHAQTTPDWLAAAHVQLAINTHFFRRLDNGRMPPPADLPLDLLGPCVSDGVVVSPADETPAPVLALTRDRRPRIALLRAAELADLDDVVSGLPGAATQPGGLLIADGRNTGDAALPQPGVRHPRTAAGISADGRTLLLLVVDGRQPDWSVGVTCPELADLLLAAGAATAVNLDGGGSSSFVYDPPDGPRLVNRPSDGAWRPVGASLGVRIRDSGIERLRD
jgi:hypothetical protein